MTEKLNVPGLSEDERVTLNLLVDQLASRSRRNRLRAAYYDGKHFVRNLGGVIPPQYESLGTVLGWAAKGVDGLARRCHLDRFVWPDGDLGGLGIQELVDSNLLLTELSLARTDSLLHGVSYLITTQGVAGEPKALIHAKDALNATGTWNPRTRSLDNLLSVTSRKDGRVTGFVLYLPNLTISAERGRKWEVERSEHSWGVPAEPLIYRPRTSRRMGRSRITRAAMSHQDAAVRALIRLEPHMDIYAIPKMLILGANDGIFKNPDGSYKSSFQIMMGRWLGIPDDEDPASLNPRAEVEQFSAESPEPHLKQLNAMSKLIAREFDLPDSDFALTDMANPTSADAYNTGQNNLIAEAEGAMDDWSGPIRRSTMRGLAIQNGESSIPSSWLSIDAKWRNPKYTSRAEAADAGSKQLAAAPWLAETEVGLELLGLDEQQIRRALAERADAQRRQAGRNVLAALTSRGDADDE